MKKTTCEECGRKIVLPIADDVFFGAECKCGYYVTRYRQGMKPR